MTYKQFNRKLIMKNRKLKIKIRISGNKKIKVKKRRFSKFC